MCASPRTPAIHGTFFQVRAVLRRMELLEGRVSSQDQDLGSLGILCSRTDGIMTALHCRVDKLDAKVNRSHTIILVMAGYDSDTPPRSAGPCRINACVSCMKDKSCFEEVSEAVQVATSAQHRHLVVLWLCRVTSPTTLMFAVCMQTSPAFQPIVCLRCVLAYCTRKTCDASDTLALLDRRCTAAESALHATVNHGQVMTSIRSALRRFCAQVGPPAREDVEF